MGVPFCQKPQGGLTVNGNEARCFGIDIPSRCFISRLIVMQVSGPIPASNFKVELFNSENACGGESESDSVGDSTGMLPPDLYRVSPELLGVAGRLIYFSEESTGGAGFVFVGQDKDRLGKSRKLWVKITPDQGGAERTYAIAVGGESFGE